MIDPSTAALHTIGYEGSSIEDFLATLTRSGVVLIIDVRDIPISRKNGFSKKVLAQHLIARGIDYLHLKGLGDPTPGRAAARDGRFEEFQRIFHDHLRSEPAQADLARAIEEAKSRCACLLCFEREHQNCHRGIVAEEMARRSGFRLRHLEVKPSWD